MKTYPIYVARKNYRGADPKKRAKTAEYNRERGSPSTELPIWGSPLTEGATALPLGDTIWGMRPLWKRIGQGKIRRLSRTARRSITETRKK